jgi:hypothetical protein
MDNKKFEKLIDLIINENEDQARALFHDIVVEKSREIYESLMDEEMGTDESMGMLDELSAENDAEEQGAFEADEEFDDIEVGDDGMGDEEVDLDSDDMGDESEEDLEDRVVDLEDKLDQLMAEFEDIMGQEDGEDMGDEDFGDEGGEDFGGEEDDEMMEAKEEDEEEVTEAEEDDEEEDTLEEAIQLKKVSVTHGDNGVQNKSPVAGKNSMISSNGAKAVQSGFQDSGKGGTQGGVLNPTTKDIKHAGQYGNSPNSFKFKEKGEAAPKPKHGDDGQNTKSIVGEGKKAVKKPVTKPATTTKKIVKK